MKSNFHMETTKHNHEFHINLHGTFDGASAFELINAIQEGEKQCMAMFIDTSHLNAALPFGQAVLESNLPKNGMRNKLHFKGEWAGDIVPEGCNLLTHTHSKGHKCTGQCKNCRCRRTKQPTS